MEKGKAVQWVMEHRDTWEAICNVNGKQLSEDEFGELVDMAILRSKEGEGFEVILFVLLTVYRDWTIF
ncbi:hypothetical protein ACG0Z4_25350 [Enterocloster aldenensis]|uniref:hypothetical protein n=1 Tax=Enterocloster aldenensis TaxID=358742 RepID=UPI004029F972